MYLIAHTHTHMVSVCVCIHKKKSIFLNMDSELSVCRICV
jgi:hypothetical protein